MTDITEVLGSDTNESYKIFLVDGSISGSKPEKNFCWDIYEKWNFGSLDSEYIEEEIRNTEEFKKVLQHPRTRTIPEITKELEGKNRIISEHIRFYSGVENGRPKRMRKKDSKRTEKPEILLKELQKQTYEIIQKSKQKELQKDKELKINNREYLSLVQMVSLISQKRGLKQDSKYKYGGCDRDRSYDSDTDERLIAAAFYLSMYSKNMPIILTRDMDLIFILEATPALIGADEFLPYNWDFKEALVWNTPKIYFKNGNEFETAKRQWNRRYYTKAIIRGATPKEGLEVREIIRKLWKGFGEN